MSGVPSTLEQFLALPAVSPFEGKQYELVDPEDYESPNDHVFCIANRVEEWVLVKDGDEFKRLKKPNVQKLFMDCLKARLPETPRGPPIPK